MTYYWAVKLHLKYTMYVRLFPLCLILLKVDLLIATDFTIQQTFNSTFQSRSLKAIDWCSLECPKTPNIACILEGDCLAINPPCQFETLDKVKLVQIHNELRNQFAMGKEPFALGIEVADMMTVEWDDELAFTASCNLKTCPEFMVHDGCHITPTFATSGQNLAQVWGVSDCVTQHEEMIYRWYQEVRGLSSYEIQSWGKKYQHFRNTAHFTQIIWSRVTHIGCSAYLKILETGNKKCTMACNYGPAGNILGSRMFNEGSPASACPEGIAPNSKYSGLCGRAGRNSQYLDSLVGSLVFVFMIFLLH